jgi:hypothetical protein
MPKGLEADISRRRGRAELLIADLERLPADYRPRDDEVAVLKGLASQIAAALKQWRAAGKGRE